MRWPSHTKTLAPVNIGQVILNATVFNFSGQRNGGGVVKAAAIPTEVEAFFDLLEERSIDYLLVGGVAMLVHVRGRNTEDVDLIVSLGDQDRLQPPLRLEERESFFARAFFGSLRIDFLQAEYPLFAQVMREFSETRTFDFLRGARTIRCATPAGLLLLKLYALPSLYRQGQIGRAKIYEGDIGSLLTAFPDLAVEEIFGLLLRHGLLASDVSELRRVVAEQRPRPDRFG